MLYQRDYLHLLVKYGLEAPSQLAPPDDVADSPGFPLAFPRAARGIAADASAEGGAAETA